ncbi:MAG: HIT family protein [Actinomycetaceae bacterium]|nr:HIT family protein [Actinomycetaceae bacterium]MDY6083113.1 HIT family protein [Actinomycetaceae bacterium]
MSVFTQIIEGTIPGRFAYEDDVCVAFATVEPITPGHMLVVPRQEVAKYTDLDEQTWAHLMTVAQRIGKAQIEAFSVPRSMLIVAGLQVPHTHIHVIAATSEQDILFANARSDVPASEMDSAVQAVRTALVKLGFGQYVPTSMNELDEHRKSGQPQPA